MATLGRGATFSANDTVTNTKLHNLVDGGTVSNIVNADIDSAAAIADTKLAAISTAGKVSGAALTGLSGIPSGAGVIPAANLIALASQAEAEAGTENTKTMTPLRVAQAIDAQAGPTDAFGSWDATKADDTVYQAATDGIVHVTLSATESSGDNYGRSYGYTDAANPPTVIRSQCFVSDRDTSSIRLPVQSFTMAVKKGEYWKVVKSATGIVTQVIYWIPKGS